MPSDNHDSAPIEFFFWAKDDQNRDKLVYYDREGNSYEKPIPHDLLEDTLKIFDKQMRSIRRSSGGLVLAEPFQLVLFDRNTGPEGKTPSLGIRVRFIDLKRDEMNRVISSEALIHTKIVAPSDLRKPFHLDTQNPPKFIAEFGAGLVPIHVFQYVSDDDGLLHAQFVLLNELDQILAAPKGSSHLLQPYSILRDVLRVAEPLESGHCPEFEVAKENIQLQGVVLDIDENTGKAISIVRIQKRLEVNDK